MLRFLQIQQEEASSQMSSAAGRSLEDEALNVSVRNLDKPSYVSGTDMYQSDSENDGTVVRDFEHQAPGTYETQAAHFSETNAHLPVYVSGSNDNIGLGTNNNPLGGGIKNILSGSETKTNNISGGVTNDQLAVEVHGTNSNVAVDLSGVNNNQPACRPKTQQLHHGPRTDFDRLRTPTPSSVGKTSPVPSLPGNNIHIIASTFFVA